ncbi:MAG: DinB family protein [Planctomycetes bacterium]|nr:DinB family protein [Planctomycetota bacterium]
MKSELIEGGLAAMAFARRMTLMFLEDIPDDKWCHQPTENGNHAFWVVGHIAHSDNFFRTLGKQESNVPAEWDGLFGMGSVPQTSASAYPSPAELRDALATQRESLTAWLGSLDAEQAAKPLEGDMTQFASSYGNLPGSIACHESVHAGQLTVVRKSLGMPPKFG